MNEALLENKHFSKNNDYTILHDDNTHKTCLLMFTVIISNIGTLALKYAQLQNSRPHMILGYFCEGCAFLIYPLNFQYFSLRFVIIAWSGSSNIVAFLGGIYLFQEQFSFLSLVGCIFNILGIFIVAIA